MTDAIPSAKIFEGIAVETQLFQAAIQVIMSRLIRQSTDPIAMCSGLQQDVLHILRSAPISPAHATQLQRVQALAIDRVSELFRPLELTAAVLSGGTSASGSRKN